jgi:hypothetical protein
LRYAATSQNEYRQDEIGTAKMILADQGAAEFIAP